MSIRILQILHSMNRGGAENALMNYYRHIDRRLLQFDFLITEPRHCDFEDEIEALGGRIFRIAPLTKSKPWLYINELNSFFANHQEYKIVHSHTSSKSVIPLYIAKKNGILIRISHSHNTRSESGLNGIIRNLLKYPLKWVASDYFSCGIEAGMWLYGNKMVEKGKVVVMPNVIDGARFEYNQSVRDSIRRELCIEPDTLLLGCVARFGKQKNHTFLLDIFADLLSKKSNVRLILLGDGELRGELNEKANSLGVNDKIIWKGVVPNVPEYEQAMDIFLMPSLYEGLPLSVVEAQIAGLPCYISDTVTREVDMTGLLTYLPINQGTKPWVDKIVHYESNGRRGYLGEIKENGYDAETSAEWLQNYYLKRLKDIK